MYKRIKWRKILLSVVIVIACYVIFSVVSICLYSRVSETRMAGAAIVLGAAVWGDKPSPVFEERIKHAVWLYKNYYTDTLIFTGGKGEGQQYSEAAVARQYAIDNGVPAGKIFIEEQSAITEENLEYILPILREKHISSVLIVSDPLHMKRAMCMARDYKLPRAYPSPTPTSKYTSLKSKAGFLARETFFYVGYQVCRIFKS